MLYIAGKDLALPDWAEEALEWLEGVYTPSKVNPRAVLSDRVVYAIASNLHNRGLVGPALSSYVAAFWLGYDNGNHALPTLSLTESVFALMGHRLRSAS